MSTELADFDSCGSQRAARAQLSVVMAAFRPLGPAGQRVAARSRRNGQPWVDVRVGEAGWVLPKHNPEHLLAIRSMEVRPSDVWLLTFPKSGTTWASEMVWLLANDLDFDAAKKTHQVIRFPYLEYNAIFNPFTEAFQRTMKKMNGMPRDKPRYIKSHLPVELLPVDLFRVNPKMIHVSRDPRDACVSYYHLYRLVKEYDGDFKDFVSAFLADEVNYAPYWRHIQGFLELKGQDNLLLLTYEEMSADLRAVIQRTAEFLGVNPPAGKVDALLDFLSFESMKRNPAVNREGKLPAKTPDDNFIREGKVGGWASRLDEEDVARFREWREKNLRAQKFSIPRASL